MKATVDLKEIPGIVIRQLGNFFPLSEEEKRILTEHSREALRRCEYCFSHVTNKYYNRNGEAFFNPFHSGQWLTFLYYLSNTISKTDCGDGENKNLADKIYYLNKIMNSVDLYHEIELPEVFFFEHPLGLVIGRAQIEEGLVAYQGCTIGGNFHNGEISYPRVGKNFRMFANSKLLGNCEVGDNVILSADACVKDTDIPSDTVVFGKSPNLILKKR